MPLSLLHTAFARVKTLFLSWGVFFALFPLLLHLFCGLLPLLNVLSLSWEPLPKAIWPVIFQTGILAISTTISCLLIGIRYAHSHPPVVSAIPFCINVLLHAHAWNRLFERTPLLHTPLAISIAQVHASLPLLIIPLSLSPPPAQLVEAAKDLGGNSWQVLKTVILPLSWPQLRTGAWLVFLSTCTELAIPEIVGGDRWAFAGGTAADYILHGETRSVGIAIAIVSSATLSAIAIVIHGMLRVLLA